MLRSVSMARCRAAAPVPRGRWTHPPGEGRTMRIIRYALAAALSLAAGTALAQGFSDTSVEYKYGPNYREPGIRGVVPKNIVTLTHVDGGTMWSNFVNLDALFSYNNDPANN